MDLAALPPGWLHSLFTTGSGKTIGSAAVAGSTETSFSVVSTATRWPSTGVLGVDFLRMLHPLAAAAAINSIAILIVLVRCIRWVLSSKRRHRCARVDTQGA